MDHYIDALVQDPLNSDALALEILQTCTQPPKKEIYQ